MHASFDRSRQQYPSIKTGIFFAVAAVLLLCATPASADPLAECASHIPWGAPTTPQGVKIDLVCHAGYLSALDPEAKVPRWVAYELTGPHTLGCFPRTGLNFKTDPLAPAEDQARRSDYKGTPYDLGHMAPNQDFAWDEKEQRETFSFANVAPQLAGLNRQGWERGEEYVRAWAYQRGDVEVYVGSILTADDKRLGASSVDIPSAFYKIVIDRRTNEVIGFVMPQQEIAKGPIAPYVKPVSEISTMTQMTFPLPKDAKETGTSWPADFSAWRAAHSQACPK